MALAILAVTLLVKVVTYPMTKNSYEIAKKQRELKPKFDELKAKYKDDKQKLAQKQMELYKQEGINPASGCLPQLFTFIFILAPLYSIFNTLFQDHQVMLDTINSMLYNWDYLKFQPDQQLNTNLFNIDLARPNYVLPVLAAAAQFYLSRLMAPATKKVEKVAENTPDKVDDIMYNMQEQMLYTMPILTLVIGISLPAGLVWYWLVSTVLTALQYLYLNYYGKSKPGTAS